MQVNTSDTPVYMPDTYVAMTERCNNNIESLYNISNKISHFVASHRLHSSTGLTYTEPQTSLNVHHLAIAIAKILGLESWNWETHNQQIL